MKTVSVKSLDELVEAGVIQLTRGKIISKTDMAACPGSYPVYSSAKENDGKFGEYGRFMFDEDLITWSVDGGGRLFYRPKHKFSVTNVGGVLRILDRATLDYRYLFYALTLRHSEITFDWVKKAHPSVIRKLYTDIPVLPIPEQQRIVGILDAAFDGIATAKAKAEQNLQNARALFESHLQSVFTQRGEGWVTKELGDICDVKDGTHDSPKYVPDGIPFVTQKNVREEGLSFSNTKFISDEDHAKFYKRSNVAHGDILISMIGANRGMACLVDDERVFSIKNVGLVKANSALNQRFLLYFLKSSQAADYVSSKSKGGAQEFIGLTELRKFPVPIPEWSEQGALVVKLDALHEETQRLESLFQHKLAALAELKKSLLHQAFSGVL